MKKTHKKTDHAICTALTQLCEEQLKSIDGFQWLTHTVNYKQFPRSLRVICVFDSAAKLAEADESALREATQIALGDIGITLLPQQTHFDSEEQCTQQHAGNWKKRLKQQH